MSSLSNFQNLREIKLYIYIYIYITFVNPHKIQLRVSSLVDQNVDSIQKILFKIKTIHRPSDKHLNLIELKSCASTSNDL